MSENMKRLLERTLADPVVMAAVREAVLESPIVKAKDAEIATLRERLERAERERAQDRDAFLADIAHRAEEYERALEEARRVLAEVEWDANCICPWCDDGNSKHADDCALAAALSPGAAPREG
jgi:hypothetical protein